MYVAAVAPSAARAPCGPYSVDRGRGFGEGRKEHCVGGPPQQLRWRLAEGSDYCVKNQSHADGNLSARRLLMPTRFREPASATAPPSLRRPTAHPPERLRLSRAARRDIRRAAVLAREMDFYAFRTHNDGSVTWIPRQAPPPRPTKLKGKPQGQRRLARLERAVEALPALTSTCHNTRRPDATRARLPRAKHPSMVVEILDTIDC